ncbi:MAG: HAD family phosphatase [Spirochaetales bacterium]|nr:HAD family phosphatase [Spirochaetales bacterium]
MKHHAIFDLDGTLLDTERIAIAALKKAFRQYGYEADDRSLHQCIGISRPDTTALFSRLFPKAPMDRVLEQMHEEIDKAVAEHTLPVKQGISKLLEALKTKGCRMAVATSTPFAIAQEKLEQKYLMSYFKVLIGGDMITNGKPAPDIFLLAAEKLDADPDDCQVFEDSGPGIQAAHAAGMRVIYIKDIARPTEEALQLCFRKFENADEVLTVIDSLL